MFVLRHFALFFSPWQTVDYYLWIEVVSYDCLHETTYRSAGKFYDTLHEFFICNSEYDLSVI